MEKVMDEILPIMDVEQDCILSKQGDVTVVFKAELPEIFTLADQEYEAFHQTWIKAIKLLPKFSVFHKQDWFLQSMYKPYFSKVDTGFLSRTSKRFFNERRYWLAEKAISEQIAFFRQKKITQRTFIFFSGLKCNKKTKVVTETLLFNIRLRNKMGEMLLKSFWGNHLEPVGSKNPIR